MFDTFPQAAVVSISDSQRIPLPIANWLDTVYHGLPKNLLTSQTQTQPAYLAFLGRICAEKRVDLAIEIADRSAAEDCREGGPGRLSVLPECDPAAAVAAERRIQRRDQ
jgi:hypothetical protein